MNMNIQKPIAIVAAIAINCAAFAWFHAWSTAIVANATPAPVHAQKILTLPAIDVHPSAAQLRALRQARVPAAPEQANAGGGLACLVMPYYSFATQCNAAVSG